MSGDKKQQHIQVVNTDACQLPFKDNSIELIHCCMLFDILAKERDLGKALKEIYRVLIPQGWIIIYTYIFHYPEQIEYQKTLSEEDREEIVWKREFKEVLGDFISKMELYDYYFPYGWGRMELARLLRKNSVDFFSDSKLIIILRKGNKREFLSSNEKLNRQKSSFFWEERNIF